MTNKIGLDKDEDALKKIARQLGMEAKKPTGKTPKKVVKSYKKYTKTPIAKKTYTKQYDTKKKKDEGLLSGISKYFSKD